MRGAWMALGAIVAVAALGSCGGEADHLTSTTWTLAALDGRVALPQSEAWIGFDEASQFSGSTGCNSLSGTWTSSGLDIAFSEISTTLIGCPGPVGEQEAAFNAALDAARAYAIDGGTLLLMDESGVKRATFRERTNTTPAIAR